MLSYAANEAGTGGTLTVSDGVNTAHIALEGQYTTAGFEGAYGQGSGTAIAYDTAHADAHFDQLVLGGNGNDILTGSSGSDFLSGGTGNDILSGGQGADTFTFIQGETGAGNTDRIVDYNFGEGDTIDLQGVLDANFSSGSDITDFVKLMQDSNNNITLSVDTNGTADGAAFSDVCVLEKYATAGNELTVVINNTSYHLTV
jgi:Ca2+-binding RTX toxin-like protein